MIDPKVSAWVEAEFIIEKDLDLFLSILCLPGIHCGIATPLEDRITGEILYAVKCLLPLKALAFAAEYYQEVLQDDPGFNILTTMN